MTQRLDFEALKEVERPVVLQAREPRDDGSLSVLCGANHLRYINVEAQHLHEEQQVAMLVDLERLGLLAERRQGPAPTT